MPNLVRQDFEGDVDAVLAGASVENDVLLLDGGLPWEGQTLSALLFDPRWVLRSNDGAAATFEGSPPPIVTAFGEDPLARILEILPRVPQSQQAPCFCGIAGYFAYETGTRRLGATSPPGRRFDVADTWLAAYDAALVFARDDRGRPYAAELVVAQHEIFGATRRLTDRQLDARSKLAAFERRASPAIGGSVTDRSFLDERWHQRSVQRIREYLRRGDSYQVNLTGFASAVTDVHPYRAYQVETARNPVAFSCYLRTAGSTITCHSPELLLRLRGRRAMTAPIKGTIEALPGAESRLQASAKDRAEHVMIVDLCRNDLGRHAEFGSVRVDRLAQPLHLRGIVHLISHISAQVHDSGRTALLADLFPAGSITGAPKRRTLDIIAEVEESRRGPYTGSFGYVNVFGDADWNIAIRTAVWQNGRVHFGCGGGIVLDSLAESELQEARWKAQSFFDSLEAAAHEGPNHAAAHGESMR